MRPTDLVEPAFRGEDGEDAVGAGAASTHLSLWDVVKRAHTQALLLHHMPFVTAEHATLPMRGKHGELRALRRMQIRPSVMDPIQRKERGTETEGTALEARVPLTPTAVLIRVALCVGRERVLQLRHARPTAQDVLTLLFDKEGLSPDARRLFSLWIVGRKLGRASSPDRD